MVGIISNSAALFAQRNLSAANSISENSIARLSSGQKIIKASDDVSGLAIGTVLATNVSTLKTLLGSASQAQSLLQIADGGLKNIGDLLQRQKSLAVTANSGAQTAATRAYLNSEFQALTSEIDRIATSTNFNGITVLDGGIAGTGNTTIVRGSDEVVTALNYFTVNGSTAALTVNNFTGDVGQVDPKLYGNLGGTIKEVVFNSTANLLNITLDINGSKYVANGVNAAGLAAGLTVTFNQTEPSAGNTDINQFDVVIGAGVFANVTSQTTADTFKSQFNNRLQNITIRQALTFDKGQAGVQTATTSGSTIAAAQYGFLNNLQLDDVIFNLSKAENVTISGFEAISSPNGAANNNIFRAVVNGVTFQNVAVPDAALTSGSTLTLTATDSSADTIVIDFANLGAGFSVTPTQQQSFAAIAEALNDIYIGSSTDALNFQVGVQSSDALGLSLESAKSGNIYRDATGAVKTLDISTADGASEASTVLDVAINKVTEFRSTVGALQSRFNFVSANINTSIQNTDAARSAFLDTDVAETSTEFATAQVRLQASISVLAQANQLPQNLLKLIG